MPDRDRQSEHTKLQKAFEDIAKKFSVASEAERQALMVEARIITAKMQGMIGERQERQN